MNPLTYLGFTIFSVFMQFCVMELIHERFQLDKDSIRSNETLPKHNNVMNKLKQKPHALYYRSDQMSFEVSKEMQSIKYSNASLGEIITTTDISSTAIEVFYDENTSVTDDFFTTETYFPTSEFDNVTEITLLDKSSSTTAKPNLSRKIVRNEKCFCDLLYKQCDINCCCDSDCSEEEQKLFRNCDKEVCNKFKDENLYFCNSYSTCDNSVSSGVFDNLFCVVKVNLPDKRVRSHFTLNEASINNTYKWKTFAGQLGHPNFEKKIYESGDLIWFLRHNSIYSLFLPTKVSNNYCNGEKQMKFLIDERINCNVKLDDLYGFSALKAIEGSKLISVTDVSSNNTVLNCSALHCTNWTIFICNNGVCGIFNRTIHALKCTEKYCKNLPLKVEYIFYYADSKIANATVKLHMNTISKSMLLLKQEILVKWYFGNETIENTIQLSGNPGYILGLPIITSSTINNHTRNFYNKTSRLGKNSIIFPENENGKCVWSNRSKKTLLFGHNARYKCRYDLLQNMFTKNATSACKNIQNSIKRSFGLSQKLYVSPYGNPRDLNDAKWIPLEVFDETFLYGEYHLKETKLSCFNLVTRYAFIMAFADMGGLVNSEESKIIKATVEATSVNLTFDKSDISIVLTVDSRFIDISKPISEFAKAPHLNIHLPKDFFFDYPSNQGFTSNCDIHLVILFTSYVLLNK